MYARRKILIRRIPPFNSSGTSSILPDATPVSRPRTRSVHTGTHWYTIKKSFQKKASLNTSSDFPLKLPDFPHFPLNFFFFSPCLCASVVKLPLILAPSRPRVFALKLRALPNPVNRVNPVKKTKKAPPFQTFQPKPSAISIFSKPNPKNPRHFNYRGVAFSSSTVRFQSSLWSRLCSLCHGFAPPTNPSLPLLRDRGIHQV